MLNYLSRYLSIVLFDKNDRSLIDFISVTILVLCS